MSLFIFQKFFFSLEYLSFLLLQARFRLCDRDRLQVIDSLCRFHLCKDSMLPSLPQRNARCHETNRWFLLALKGYQRSERARIALNVLPSPSVLYG
jgi:hypothetical protein